MFTFFRLAFVMLIVATPIAASADDKVAGTLQYVDNHYHFTTQSHPGIHFSAATLVQNLGVNQNLAFSVDLLNVKPWFLSDLDDQKCAQVECFESDAVHTFFQGGRLVTFKYAAAGVVVPLGAALQSADDHDALMKVIAQNFPLSEAAQTAPTPDGKPLYVHYDSSIGRCSMSVEVSNDGAILQSIRYQNEFRDCQKQQANDPDADSKWEHTQQVEQEAAQAAERLKQERQQEAQHAADVARQKQASDDAARKSRAEIAALPETHRAAANEVTKCVDKVDLMSCFSAEMTASSNYGSDKAIHDNHALCVDRRIMVAAGLYRVQLTTGYFTQNDTFRIDQTLGEIVDDCPEQASWALNVRRKLHSL